MHAFWILALIVLSSLSHAEPEKCADLTGVYVLPKSSASLGGLCRPRPDGKEPPFPALYVPVNRDSSKPMRFEEEELYDPEAPRDIEMSIEQRACEHLVIKSRVVDSHRKTSFVVLFPGESHHDRDHHLVSEVKWISKERLEIGVHHLGHFRCNTISESSCGYVAARDFYFRLSKKADGNLHYVITGQPTLESPTYYSGCELRAL